jgi:hypothetical protein
LTWRPNDCTVHQGMGDRMKCSGIRLWFLAVVSMDVTGYSATEIGLHRLATGVLFSRNLYMYSADLSTKSKQWMYTPVSHFHKPISRGSDIHMGAATPAAHSSRWISSCHACTLSHHAAGARTHTW